MWLRCGADVGVLYPTDFWRGEQVTIGLGVGMHCHYQSAFCLSVHMLFLWWPILLIGNKIIPYHAYALIEVCSFCSPHDCPRSYYLSFAAIIRSLHIITFLYASSNLHSSCTFRCKNYHSIIAPIQVSPLSAPLAQSPLEVTSILPIFSCILKLAAAELSNDSLLARLAFGTLLIYL